MKSLLLLVLSVITVGAAELIDLGPGIAYSINDSSQVALVAQDRHVMLWQNDSFTSLGLMITRSMNQSVGINEKGDVCAGIEINGVLYPAIWSNGNIVSLGSLGGVSNGVSGYCHAINDQGKAVGISYLPSGMWHAFLWDGQIHDLGDLGEGVSQAYGINNLGQVVGGASEKPFLFSGSMRDVSLTIQGGRAYDINDSGQITGYYHKSYDLFGFILGRSICDVFSAQGSYAAGFAINNAGVVVGGSYRADCRGCEEFPRAIRYDGRVTDLNTIIPSNMTRAFGINSEGKIVGEMEVNGLSHGFLLIP